MSNFLPQISDRKELQVRLANFANGNEEYIKITRAEASYLADVVNEDWRKD